MLLFPNRHLSLTAIRDWGSPLVGALALVLAAGPAIAQQFIELVPCPEPPADLVPGEAEVTAMAEQVECLKRQVAELTASQNLLLTNIVDVYAKLEETVARIDYDLNGPPKRVESFAAVDMAVTRSRWGDSGSGSQDFACVPPLEDRAGFTKWGGDLSAPQTIPFWRGCAAGDHCDSAGEWCEKISRSAGCYVDTVWLEWFKGRAERMNIPLDAGAVCVP